MTQEEGIEPQAELRGDEETQSPDSITDLRESPEDLASSADSEGTGTEEHLAGTVPENDEMAAGQSEDESLAADSEEAEETFYLVWIAPDQDETETATAEEPELE
jgi:hypothetical protein